MRPNPPRLPITCCLFALVLTLGACQSGPGDTSSGAPGDAVGVTQTYSNVVWHSYRDAHATAVDLRKAIDAFLAEPNDTTLAAARKAWLESRMPYGRTEAFRFYEGPIDFADVDTGEQGPEAQLNSWPLNEAWIDEVRGRPVSGIMHELEVGITR